MTKSKSQKAKKSTDTKTANKTIKAASTKKTSSKGQSAKKSDLVQKISKSKPSVKKDDLTQKRASKKDASNQKESPKKQDVKKVDLVLQRSEKNNGPLVLIVEDDRSMLIMLETRLLKKGYRVITAVDGRSAREQIEKHHKEIDVVLLDRVMPDIDGLEIVEWIDTRPDIFKMPIVMQTGSDQPEQVKEGIDAGVFYYLTKPIQESILNSVLNSAVKESKRSKLLRQELEKHKLSFSLIYNARFYLRNIDEAENLACFIANSFPDSEKVVSGIAELLINAIEHGKCKITYEEKSKLVEKDQWRDEVRRRCNLKENIHKVIEVIFQRQNDRYSIRIDDRGDGFPWKKYLKVDPSRAMDNHGRGIARANTLFDRLIYNKVGNIVIAVIDPSLREHFEW